MSYRKVLYTKVTKEFPVISTAILHNSVYKLKTLGNFARQYVRNAGRPKFIGRR